MTKDQCSDRESFINALAEEEEIFSIHAAFNDPDKPYYERKALNRKMLRERVIEIDREEFQRFMRGVP